MEWENIGRRIKSIRNEKKMTQTQFGELINVSRQNVSKIERGRRSSVEQIDAICRKTGVSIVYVLYGSPDFSINIDFLNDFSSLQIEICFDLLKRLAEFIKTPNGNKMLLRELVRQKSLWMGG